MNDSTTINKAMIMINRLKIELKVGSINHRLAVRLQSRIKELQTHIDYLKNQQFKIAFVGSVGRGKSSLINVITGLVLDGKCSTKSQFKSNSVLSVGGGRTTVCEIEIQTDSKNDKIVMTIEPMDYRAMVRQIHDFAADEWRLAKESSEQDADAGPTPKEVARVIRNMTDLNVRRVEGKGKKIKEDPIKSLIEEYDTQNEFAQCLVERANLEERSETVWVFNHDLEGFKELKDKFSKINTGKMITATLPKKIIIRKNKAIPESHIDQYLSVTDTRGLDNRIESRGDIKAVLKDDRCLVLYCTSFNEAPDEGLKSFIESIKADLTLQKSLTNLHILLVDKDEACQVNGADEERVEGQEIKVEECLRGLKQENHHEIASIHKLVAFDVFQDSPSKLVDFIDTGISDIREGARLQLEANVQEAASFLENIENEHVQCICDEIDDGIRRLIQSNFPKSICLRDPLKGIYQMLLSTHTSTLHALNRRQGIYYSNSVYDAVNAGAAEAYTKWMRDLRLVVEGHLNALLVNPDFNEAHDHISLRSRQLNQHWQDVVSEYAEDVQQEVEAILYEDMDHWDKCYQRWGGGSGYRINLKDYFVTWSDHRADIEGHTRTSGLGRLSFLEA